MSRWAATSARDWGRYFSTQGEALMSGGVPETMTFFPLSFGFKFWFSSSSKSISDTVSASAILFAGLALSCSLSLSLSLSHPPFAARFTVEGTLTATAGSVEAWAVFFFWVVWRRQCPIRFYGRIGRQFSGFQNRAGLKGLKIALVFNFFSLFQWFWYLNNSLINNYWGLLINQIIKCLQWVCSPFITHASNNFGSMSFRLDFPLIGIYLTLNFMSIIDFPPMLKWGLLFK